MSNSKSFSDLFREMYEDLYGNKPKSELTVNEWMKYKIPLEDAVAYPNALKAYNIVNSPLYAAMNEDTEEKPLYVEKSAKNDFDANQLLTSIWARDQWYNHSTPLILSQKTYEKLEGELNGTVANSKKKKKK